MELIERIKAEIQAFDEKRKQLSGELQKEFPKLLQPLLEKSKVIESIGWTQYTPYFNDGDSCEFQVHNSDLDINGVDYYDLEDEFDIFEEEIWSSSTRRTVPNPNYNPEEAEILNQIKEILHSIPKDFYEDLFGDHVQVTVYRDGRVEVEDYDHD